MDKAAQTPVFMCKKLIRCLAFKRLSSLEFVKTHQNEDFLQELVKTFCKEFKIFTPNSFTFPYIMGMYKAHKNDFRWITNAHDCAFTSITDINTKLLSP